MQIKQNSLIFTFLERATSVYNFRKLQKLKSNMSKDTRRESINRSTQTDVPITGVRMALRFLISKIRDFLPERLRSLPPLSNARQMESQETQTNEVCLNSSLETRPSYYEQAASKREILDKKKKLDLSCKQIRDDEVLDDVLSNCTNPKTILEIKLNQNCKITKIPTSISQFENIINLEMVNNNIREIPWSIVYLRKLEFLNLSLNSITCISRYLTHLPSLKSLIVAYNPITFLPTELVFALNLKTLDVTGCEKLVSPPLDKCMAGHAHIMKLLWYRLDRQDSLKRLSFVDDHMTGVTSLLDMCIDTILHNKINFFNSPHLPPVIKNSLQEVEAGKSNYIRISKCSMCLCYFSTQQLFDNHTCKQHNS